MIETNEKKNNKLTHLLSLLAIVALLICMTVVIFIRINKGNSVDIADSIENKDNEELITELEEVHTYLETLESAVNESTLTLETLKQTENPEDSEEVNKMIENLDTIYEKLNTTRGDISELKKQLESSNEYDSGVMIENFMSVYSRVNELKEQMNHTLNSIESLQGDNQRELISEVKRIENSINKNSENSFNGILGQMKASDSDIINRIDDAEKRLGAKIDQNKSDSDKNLEQVFGYVASGKKGIASALATIGSTQGIDAENNEAKILSFSEIKEIISHSQDISGTYEKPGGETESLNGACENNLPYGYAAWVNGKYILGNGKDIEDSYQSGYQEGYTEGYGRGHGDGYIEGLQEIHNAQISYVYHEHTTSDGTVRAADYQSLEPDGCFTHPVYKTVEYTYYDQGCTCSCQEVHWSEYPDKAPDGTGAGSRTLECDDCNHGDHRGGVCGSGAGQKTGYKQEIDYYVCGCNKTDYATDGENATIVSATINFAQ